MASFGLLRKALPAALSKDNRTKQGDYPQQFPIVSTEALKQEAMMNLEGLEDQENKDGFPFPATTSLHDGLIKARNQSLQAKYEKGMKEYEAREDHQSLQTMLKQEQGNIMAQEVSTPTQQYHPRQGHGQHMHRGAVDRQGGGMSEGTEGRPPERSKSRHHARPQRAQSNFGYCGEEPELIDTSSHVELMSAMRLHHDTMEEGLEALEARIENQISAQEQRVQQLLQLAKTLNLQTLKKIDGFVKENKKTMELTMKAHTAVEASWETISADYRSLSEKIDSKFLSIAKKDQELQAITEAATDKLNTQYILSTQKYQMELNKQLLNMSEVHEQQKLQLQNLQKAHESRLEENRQKYFLQIQERENKHKLEMLEKDRQLEAAFKLALAKQKETIDEVLKETQATFSKELEKQREFYEQQKKEALEEREERDRYWEEECRQREQQRLKVEQGHRRIKKSLSALEAKQATFCQTYDTELQKQSKRFQRQQKQLQTIQQERRAEKYALEAEMNRASEAGKADGGFDSYDV